MKRVAVPDVSSPDAEINTQHQLDCQYQQQQLQQSQKQHSQQHPLQHQQQQLPTDMHKKQRISQKLSLINFQLPTSNRGNHGTVNYQPDGTMSMSDSDSLNSSISSYDGDSGDNGCWTNNNNNNNNKGVTCVSDEHGDSADQSLSPNTNTTRCTTKKQTPSTNSKTTHESKAYLDCPKPSSLHPDMSPDTYIQHLFHAIIGFTPTAQPTLELTTRSQIMCNESFFNPISEENINDYGADVVEAARNEDLSKLRTIHESGRSMSCCNRYGESLLHMACRRGFSKIVTFLVQEAGVPIRITDDCGRTPFHDTLWNRECQYSIFDMLIRRDPVLLLTKDKRGHTPFAYARKEHWEQWKEFLYERKDVIGRAIARNSRNDVELFRKDISVR